MNTRNRHGVRDMFLVHGIIVGLVSFIFVRVVAVEIAGKFI